MCYLAPLTIQIPVTYGFLGLFLMKVCFYIKNNDFGPKKVPKFGLLSSDQALNKNIRK